MYSKGSLSSGVSALMQVNKRSKAKNHSDSSFLSFRAQRPEPNALFPKPSAITCDECGRIKQDICRLFGLSMISSMQISGRPFHQDLKLSCEAFLLSAAARSHFPFTLITVLIKWRFSPNLTDLPQRNMHRHSP